jgi:hypothetical protein
MDLIFSVESNVVCFQRLFVVLHPDVVDRMKLKEGAVLLMEKVKAEIAVNAGCTQMPAEHACTPTQVHVSKTFRIPS